MTKTIFRAILGALALSAGAALGASGSESPSPGGDGLRRLRGEVLFVNSWRNYCVVAWRAADAARSHVMTRVNLAADTALPPVGAFVAVAGVPVASDDGSPLWNARCDVVPASDAAVAPECPSTAELQALLLRREDAEDDLGYRFLRVTGRVLAVENAWGRRGVVRLETSGGSLSALVPAASFARLPDLADQPLVEMTGILDARSPRNGRNLTTDEPRLLLRSLDDIRLLPDAASARRRFLRRAGRVLLYASLPLAGLGLFLLLRAQRRRALARAVAADRLRIAEELHDAVSQQLAGARMMIFSVKERPDLAPEAKENLSLAIDVLESAHHEVRGAVLKLKDDAFMIRPVQDLIRQGVAQVAARGGVRIRAQLGEFPPDIVGEAKSDLIAIVQEAVTNAIRHGRARRIAILAGRTDGGRFALSVLNDGAPFDAATALGPETGHFGISGMRARAARSGFALSFARRRDWTEVRLERSFA